MKREKYVHPHRWGKPTGRLSRAQWKRLAGRVGLRVLRAAAALEVRP